MNLFKWLFPAFFKGEKEPDKSAIQKPLPDTIITHNRIPLKDANRDVKLLVIHCAATPEGRPVSIDTIRKWHKGRGWSDIGYHYVVHLDGTIAAGRPVNLVGAHVKGKNTGSIGICYVGGVSAGGKVAKDTRTAEQRKSLLWLTQALAEKYKPSRIAGHNEFSAKACPSFDVRTDELGNIKGYSKGKRTAKR